MKWLSFQRKFHKSWWRHMKNFIESPACDEIFAHLKSRAIEEHRIMPISHNTFKAFELPLDEIKVVILGGNPYDGFIDDLTVANGLFLDCSNLPAPSYELRNFYQGLENEIFNGLSLHYKDTESIDYLTKQGVLMLNAALTIEDCATHEKLWEPFTKHVIKILDSLDVPILFIGDLAQSYAPGISNRWRTSCLNEIPEEPSKVWETGHVFRRIDEILEEQNKESIMWLNIDAPF